MKFTKRESEQARKYLAALKADPSHAVAAAAIEHAVNELVKDPLKPPRGLRVHAWQGELCPHGKTKLEAWASTSGAAYRVWYCLCRAGASEPTINFIAYGPHA